MRELPEILGYTPTAFVVDEENFSMRLEGGAMIGVMQGHPLTGWTPPDPEALIRELTLRAQQYRMLAQRLDKFVEVYAKTA